MSFDRIAKFYPHGNSYKSATIYKTPFALTPGGGLVQSDKIQFEETAHYIFKRRPYV
jgi:hypothetical protein